MFTNKQTKQSHRTCVFLLQRSGIQSAFIFCFSRPLPMIAIIMSSYEARGIALRCNVASYV